MIGRAVYLLRRTAAAAALLMTALASSAPAVAQGTGPTGAADVHEGIKVVGHWIIEVRNPDGATVATHEFNNALGDEGQRHLHLLLTRGRVQGYWGILLDGDPRPCTYLARLPSPCQIGELPWDATEGEGTFFQTLTIEAAGAQLLLSGYAIADRDAEVRWVQTFVTWCASESTAPSVCAATLAPGAAYFSGTTLQTPISVEEGQAIEVHVTFTFSQA
jgi:hypothetical protein